MLSLFVTLAIGLLLTMLPGGASAAEAAEPAAAQGRPNGPDSYGRLD